jgi:hypothetical protein
MKRIAAALLAMCVASASLADSPPRPFEALAARIPLAAPGLITFCDLDAARRQAVRVLAPDEIERQELVQFGALHPPAGFDVQMLGRLEGDGSDLLGFSVYEIDQMAGFGTLPTAPVILTGLDGAEGRMAEALSARGFAHAERDGTAVWHLQEDYRIDVRAGGADPFATRMGASQRFAFKDGALLFARGWPEMDKLLAPGLTLAIDSDAMAILRAGYTLNTPGEFLEAILFSEPMVRMASATDLLGLTSADDIAEARDRILSRPGFDLPGLPLFRRFGLLFWQDGGRLTGAIAIPYPTRELAETARDRFTALVAAMHSPSANKPFAELLPASRAFDIVDLPGKSVAVLAFTQEIDPEERKTVMMFSRHPETRFLQFYIARELALLIGAAEGDGG